jgi:hypothetical protein
MTGDIQANTLVMYLKKPITDGMFKISVQHVLYGAWNECKIKTTTSSQRIVFECDSRQPLKSIRIEFNEEQEESFQLCGLGLDNFIV